MSYPSANRFVYLAARNDGYLKVGIAANPLNRVLAFSGHRAHRAHRENRPPLSDGATVQVEVIRTVAGGLKQEREIQKALAGYSVVGCAEWFRDTAEARRVALGAMSRLGPDMRSSEERLVQVGLRFPKGLWKLVRIAAAHEEKSAQQIVTDILRTYLKAV